MADSLLDGHDESVFSCCHMNSFFQQTFMFVSRALLLKSHANLANGNTSKSAAIRANV